MEWHEEDELKEQWEEVKKMEERLKPKKVGASSLQKVPELEAYQRSRQKVEGSEERKK